jgi:uncharacterized protein YfeS
MKYLSTIFILLTLSTFGQSNANAMSYPSFENANARAKLLMNEEFYFSTIDDFAPFGSDDAADTYSAFYEWRQSHKNESLKSFILDHLQHWGYPLFDMESTDFIVLKPYLKQNDLGSIYMFGIDASIISTAFGQLYLEGNIDLDIRDFAKKAITREQLPEILNLWNKNKIHRQETLTKMSNILNSIQ